MQTLKKKNLLSALITVLFFTVSFNAQSQWTNTASPSLTTGSILISGTTGATPASGAGTRLMYIPSKGAFRAGIVSGTNWDAANIGNYSTAFGTNSTASGTNSIAGGNNATASGSDAVGLGGYSAATGTSSIAFGYLIQSTASSSFTIGRGVSLSPSNFLTNNIANSLMVGFNSTIPTLYVGPSSGTGTTGTVAVATTTIPTNAPTGGYKFVVSGNSNLDGSMVIGDASTFTASTPFPSGYNLYVANGIFTEKIKVAVKTSASWSDFVFDKSYKLTPLIELESYINKNKHLPGIPSADEVVKEGLDLAAMDAKLLQKVEELTLYMIEMKKENNELKKKNEDLAKRVETLETN
jgi:hypothetical protein